MPDRQTSCRLTGPDAVRPAPLRADLFSRLLRNSQPVHPMMAAEATVIGYPFDVLVLDGLVRRNAPPRKS
ncbi:hypothetical protein GGQ68_000782 [Sagittula marina]|uniref:Uncharacterized protein n=1 Tax=Sagittula marina TaxID=943940 RepID=A0A7W6GQL7_9RHOB|nr:hypothetical protein [Sagittula marina]